eukprot:9501414-Pyramimonas_sp.AAC.1
MQAAVEEQRARVGRLQSDCQQVEDLQKQLVNQLHAQVKSSDEPMPAKSSPWSVRSILTGTIGEIPITLGRSSRRGGGGWHRSFDGEKKKGQADKLVTELKKGIQEATFAL